jgi:hypothetical protein
MMHPISSNFALAGLIALSFCAALPQARADQAAASPANDLRTPSSRYADLQKAEDPSFRKHVVPLLARVGCSSRECHGSFQGRGGFQLSLFGSEWDRDYVALTKTKGDEDETHIDPASPEKSLILLKPTMQVKHKGKERFKKDGWEYNLLLKWIQGGAKNDADKTGELAKLEVTPSELVFGKQGQAVQLKVLAHWADGSVEDVTELTRFKTNDETVASVSDNGLVASTGKGDSHIVASYDNGVLPIPVMLAVSEFNGSKFPAVSTHTQIDALVVNKLRKVGIIPSEICGDSEFLRRVSLDLTGTLPTPDQVRAFTADNSPNKRAAKIDELMKTPAYAGWWATKFCDYTGNSPRELNNGGNINRNPGALSRQWYEWLYKRVADNVPYDQMVADIVLATSRSSPTQSFKDYSLEMNSYFRADHPADYANHPTLAYYWQRRNEVTPADKALAFSHTFLGVRLECAQCHKHPFDRWTKRDFEQFTAFFNMITFSPGPKVAGEELNYQSLEKEIREKIEAEYDKEHPNTDGKVDVKKRQITQKLEREEYQRRIEANEVVPWYEVWMNTRNLKVKTKAGAKIDPSITPKLLGGDRIDLREHKDPREPLVAWLRSRDNPYFAKAIVNRVWATYFNRGIVDPPDDLNIANAPCNGDLLNYLANGLIDHKFDLQWLHREILNSDTYQRSWQTNATNVLDTRNFSHSVVRQLPAEVMLDAIDMAIGPENVLASYSTEIDRRAIGPTGASQYTKPGKGTKGAGQGNDGYFLTLFGKPTRENNCDCERSTDPTLLQTLFTRNDPNLLGRIEGNGGPNGSWIGELRKKYNPNSKNAPKLDVDQAIDEVFLRTVSRLPNEQEMEEAHSDVTGSKNPVDGIRDLLWAMVNTREFKVNH